jgi:translation initiation factor IF-3
LSTPDKGDPRRPEPRRDLPLINERIRDREVRLIDEDGSQLGIVLTREALTTAKEKGLDLLLVQPDANPPVARILDYGRHKFELDKKTRETKKKHHIVDVKEIKMRYKIEEHDYQVKLRNAIKFLTDGDKVKVLTILRGREMQHKDMAMRLMNKFADELKDLGMMDREPKMEGKSVIMILSPLPQRGGGSAPGRPATSPNGDDSEPV